MKDKECKICMKPYTTYKWASSAHERYRKTVICQTCSKIRNACQCCVLDLIYALPLAERDEVLKDDGISVMPQSDTNRQYYLTKNAADVNENYDKSEFAKHDSVAKLYIKKYSRSQVSPYQNPDRKKQEANICPDFIHGRCERGRDCPYRHELPESEGEKNSIANISLPSADHSTVLVTQLTDSITDLLLDAHFSPFGNIKSVNIIKQSQIAFVNFVKAEDALKAVRAQSEIEINGVKMKCKLSKRNMPPPPPGKKKDPVVSQDDLMPPPPPGFE